jgi:hypothetical protein
MGDDRTSLAVARCRCGHARAAHEHYRRGSDCSVATCTCVQYRRQRRAGWLRRHGRRGDDGPGGETDPRLSASLPVVSTTTTVGRGSVVPLHGRRERGAPEV